MLLAIMKLFLHRGIVLDARLSALHVMLVRIVQRVLIVQTEMQLQIVRIYFKYNYI